MRHFISTIREHIRHEEIVILATIMAILALYIPLQRYISLARFQHYGIALYVWSLGFIVQTVWSWKALRKWGRLCLLSTGIYVSSLALVLYSNPWLDPRIQIQTSGQDVLRILYAISWITIGVVLAVLWVIWGIEEMRNRQMQQSKDQA